MDLTETENENVEWIPLALDGPMPVPTHTVTNLHCAQNAGDFLTWCVTVSISRWTSAM
jgi:hypothetical protein